MENERIPDEVRVTHVHNGKDEDSSFIEFIKLDDGKVKILTATGFIKRYGKELIEAFKSSQSK